MSWSISCVFVNERQDGYLGTFPHHDHRLACDIVDKLGFGPIRSSSLTSLEKGLNPENGRFSIGAYNGAVVLAAIPELYGCGENPQNEMLKKIVETFSSALILAVELSSVNNYFGFSLFKKGDLLRTLAGDADRGLIVHHGTQQAEAVEVLKMTKNQNVLKNGETIVFSLSARFLGCPLDEFCSEKLVMELVKCKRKGRLHSLFKLLK